MVCCNLFFNSFMNLTFCNLLSCGVLNVQSSDFSSSKSSKYICM